MERMTATEPTNGQPRPSQRTVQLHCLQRICTTRRIKTAPGTQQRADKPPVHNQQPDQHPAGHRRAPVSATCVRCHQHATTPCRRSNAPITRSRSAARSAWQAVAARGLARTTSRLPPGSEPRYPRARCRSLRRTLFRTTAGPTDLLTMNPTSAGWSAAGSTSKCPDTSERPARLPRIADSKSDRRRIRAVAGSICLPTCARHTLTRARPFLRRADRMARPARVRMRSRNPCVFARRRLFG
jgi:hypothetical protein